MYYRINEFFKDWNNEVVKTTKVFSMVTEDAKAIKLGDKIRTLARLAFHIPQIISQIGAQTGLLMEAELPELPLPLTMENTMTMYLDYHTRIADSIKHKWGQTPLKEEVDLYRHKWQKGNVLNLLVQHEIHHRSQMTIIMRTLGLPVPNLYGPTIEEWEMMGMKPPM